MKTKKRGSETETEQKEAEKRLALSPGRQFKFRKKDGLVAIATMLVRMCWPLPEKHIIVYLACKPFRKLTHIQSASLRFCL